MFAPFLKKVTMNFATQISFRAAFCALLMLVVSVFTASAEETKNEKFDAGKMIMEHISDAHEWHVLGEGKNAISLPLPVILYTDKGIEFFSSAKFENREASYTGKYYTYKENEKGQIEATDEGGQPGKIYDFSITKNVASLFFSAALLLWVFLTIAATYKNNPGKAPKGMQSFFEPIIVFIRDDIAKQSIGPKYEKFMPYLLTVFFFIWFNNMLGIIPVLPGGANLTGNITITAALALITFILILFNSNKNYWHHVFAMPGVPKAVLIILTPIEIMGVFLRPFVLMIRLFANITAGHIIALSFLCLIFIFAEVHIAVGYGVGIFSVAFNVFMGLMELLVALIQAYVFTLLSAIYFGAAVEEPHGHDDMII
jgi:F-type H+-transporting ATPase subunit a